MSRLFRRAVATVILAAACVLPAQAQQNWATVARISSTIGNNAGRLCIGDTKASDIGCPTYAPSLSTAGHVSITGNVSANKFIGDGSLLSGVTAATGDRIVSGTNDATRMVAISETGYISITQAGANSGWFDPYRGLVTLGVSSTGAISGTAGYFSSRVGIGTTQPAYALDVSGQVARVAHDSAQVLWANAAKTSRWGAYLFGDDLRFYDYSGGQGDRLVLKSGGNIGVGTHSPTATLQVSGSFVVSTSSQDMTPTLIVGTNERVGIRTPNPLASLDVGGSIRFTGDIYTVKGQGNYWGSNLYYDNGWKYASANNGAFLIRNAGSGIQFLTAPGGTAAGDPVTPTEHMRIASTGNVGISTTVPGAKLDVMGTISASDAIQVGQSSLACVSGISGSIRYNTTSDTLQICSGSGWKSLVSGTAGVGGVTGTGSATAVAYWSGANSLSYDTDGFYWDASLNALGIGTNNISNTLHIVRNGNSGTFAYIANNTDGVSARTGLLLGGAGTANNSGALTYGNTSYNAGAGFEALRGDALHLFANSSASGGLSLASAHSSAPMTFSTAGLATVNERMRITAAGSVGIGTATPAASLQVSGTLLVSSTQTNNAPAFYVSTSGRVGIGTAAPGTMFEVSAASGVDGIILARMAGTTGSDYAGLRLKSPNSTSAGAQIYINGTTSSSMWIHNSEPGSNVVVSAGNFAVLTADGVNGRLGVRTTNPSATLHVQGTVSVTDALQLGQNTIACGTPVSGSIRYNSVSNTVQFCNGMAWVSLASGTTGAGTLTGTGSATAVAFWNGTNSLSYDSDGFYWDGTNNRLGIGTNTPVVALTISNSSGFAFDSATAKSISWYTGGGYPVQIRGDASAVNLAFLLNGVEAAQFSPSGNLGIGTQSPTATLQVSGTFTVSNSAQTTTPSLYVGTNGNVGIGATTPAFSLDVASASSGLQLRAGNTSMASASTQIAMGYNGGLLYRSAIKTRHNSVGSTNNAIDFYVWGSGDAASDIGSRSVMTIEGTGNVGIGTNNPEASLVVSGTTQVVSAFDTTASKSGMIEIQGGSVGPGSGGGILLGAFGDTFASIRGRISDANNYGVGNLVISMRALTTDATLTERMRINEAGNVGINKATPLARLDVAGTISASDAIQLGQNTIACGVQVSGSIRYNTVSNTVQFCSGTGWMSLVSGTTGGGTLTGTGSATAVAYWSSSTGLTYDADGFYWDATNNRLGIATNAPAYSLDASELRGTSRVTSKASGSFGAVSLVSGNASNAGYLEWRLPSADGALGTRLGYFGWNTSDVQLNLENSADFVVNGGYMGIGTAIPNYPLQVQAADSATAISIRGGSAGLGDSVFMAAGARARFGYDGVRRAVLIDDRNEAGATNTKHIVFDTAGAERMRIQDSTGYVGVGTSSPQQKIHIADGTLNYLRVSTDGNTGLDLGQDSGGNALIRLRDNAIMQFYTNNTVRMTIDETGDIGVGAAPASAKVNIWGGTGSGTSYKALILQGGVAGVTGSGAQLYLSGGNGSGRSVYIEGVNTSAGSNGHAMVFGTSANGAAPAERMRIDKDGNVGIGTAAPSHILHISGQGRATNSAWATSSDRRVKEDIHTITGGLAIVEKLRPVTFHYTKEYQHGNKELAGIRRGFIAQEVEDVIPDAVTRSIEKVGKREIKDFRVLGNSDFVPLLVSAVKEVAAKLDGEVAQLKADNENLRQQVSDYRETQRAQVVDSVRLGQEMKALKAANDNQARALEELRAEVKRFSASR